MAFRDIPGNRRLVALLARSVRQNTLPPSLIFSGPPGAGKRLTAIATAQALNCLAPVLSQDAVTPGPSHLERLAYELDACGSCAACARIARGVHPDVLVVEPGDNGSIRIDQVRDVIERSAYRPFEGRRRAVIIDEADALMAAAQNALLKTLEEPPPSSVFLLLTSRPDLLLPTVRSRCPQLRFAAVSSENCGVEAREIAERVLTQAAAKNEPRTRIESARDLLTGTGAGGARDREQVASYLRTMSSLLRDIELLSTRADVRALANPDVQPSLERLAGAYQGERGLRAFAAVDKALEALDRNAGVKVVADWLVLQL